MVADCWHVGWEGWGVEEGELWQLLQPQPIHIRRFPTQTHEGNGR